MIFLQSYDEHIPTSTLKQNHTFTPCGKVESVKAKQNFKNSTTYVTYVEERSAAAALIVINFLFRLFHTSAPDWGCCSGQFSTANTSWKRQSAEIRDASSFTSAKKRTKSQSTTKSTSASTMTTTTWPSKSSKKTTSKTSRTFYSTRASTKTPWWSKVSKKQLSLCASTWPVRSKSL